MAMNRIQFQLGLSLPEFLKHFGTENTARGSPGANALAPGLSLPPDARGPFTAECGGVLTHYSSARPVAIRLR